MQASYIRIRTTSSEFITLQITATLAFLADVRGESVVVDSVARTGLLRKKIIQESGTATASEENIVLKGKGPANPYHDSYEAWVESWAAILKLRGPKW